MTTSYEKHTPTTDALDTLGSIIGPDEKRDAIHLAVENVIAGEPLQPGEDVRWDGEPGSPVVAALGPDTGIGIVDPFLTHTVRAGQRFWLVVYPRQIHSLRHVWEHPAFPPSGETAAAPKAPETKAEAEQWLRDWLDQHGDNPGFDAVMSVIETGSWQGEGHGPWEGPSGHNNWGEYIHFDGTDAHGSIPPEFWQHAEVYLGHPISEDERAEGFSCSC
jgi:hypothetical protein